MRCLTSAVQKDKVRKNENETMSRGLVGRGVENNYKAS